MNANKNRDGNCVCNKCHSIITPKHPKAMAVWCSKCKALLPVLIKGERQGFSVHDVLEAGYNLEPLKCLHCGSFEVTFNQYVEDAHCADCGKWQLAS